MRNKVFNIFSPEQGITNIFANEVFMDPDGMLALSVKQMERLKEWVRPCDVIPSDQWINGMPDIATEINGYEVSQ